MRKIFIPEISIVRQSSQVMGYCPTDRIEALRLIELVGRTCYQSMEKITDTSYAEFIQKLSDNKHYAMIEHSNLIVKSDKDVSSLMEHKYIISVPMKDGTTYYGGNYRAWMNWLDVGSPVDLQSKVLKTVSGTTSLVQNDDPDIPRQLKRITVRLKTDRAVTHELVRHRPESYGQLSQRYVDHRKCMEFILPLFLYDVPANDPVYRAWCRAMLDAAMSYSDLREVHGASPQDARTVLPNSVATEIYVTGSLTDWDWIFELRCSPAAYPQIRKLMEPVKELFQKL